MRLLLILTALFALAALAQGVAINHTSPEYRINPCDGAGAAPDAGPIQGLLLPAGLYEGRFTGSAVAALCLYDGGAVPDGCKDGGSCYACSLAAGRWFQPGTVERFKMPSGQAFNCASDGGAGVSFTPITIL